jgi:hypothetical protein
LVDRVQVLLLANPKEAVCEAFVAELEVREVHVSVHEVTNDCLHREDVDPPTARIACPCEGEECLFEDLADPFTEEYGGTRNVGPEKGSSKLDVVRLEEIVDEEECEEEEGADEEEEEKGVESRDQEVLPKEL